MFKNKSETHERVLCAVEDIKSCCEVRDDFHEWSDIAASSIQAFLEDLTAEQLDDTCSAFEEYIEETVGENENLAKGVKDALLICLKEMLDYIGETSEDEEEEIDENASDEETRFINQIRQAVKQLEEMNV